MHTIFYACLTLNATADFTIYMYVLYEHRTSILTHLRLLGIYKVLKFGNLDRNVQSSSNKSEIFLDVHIINVNCFKF